VARTKGTTGTPKTGGRQRGTPNKATVQREILAEKGLEAARLDGLLPLDVMLCRMKHEPLPNGSMVTDDQFAAAVAAAPYIHPKLSAGMFKEIVGDEEEEGDSANLTREELVQFLYLNDKWHGRTPMIEGDPLTE
jgi:hypothetical protein